MSIAIQNRIYRSKNLLIRKLQDMLNLRQEMILRQANGSGNGLGEEIKPPFRL